ncbi:MAG: adenine-specific methyltransferase EcoRI family protein, partial [Chitinivibrionia bacterium]|nr:adenine-specific methyltransferase EcoRI family protein [Chitinivibrionia bacterium]
LKDYNNMTGKSKETVYQYLFTCEVRDMKQVEDDIKDEFRRLREEKNREIYFYNKELFEDYVKFIKSHKMFTKEIFIKVYVQKEIVKIVKRTTPSLEERGVTRKELLQKAQKIKNDEFYTRYEDIEKELKMYDAEIWKDKTVFCNCDDAVDTENDRNTSAFALYFIRNFEKLSLKKLICTHFSSAVDLFNQGAKGYIFTKDGFSELKDYPKGYNGSFDDPLSLKILNEEADIVCTNPPFSRATDYWNLIINSGKKYLIISAMTNPINTAFIHYFIDNKVWAGFNRVDYFLNPKKEIVENRAYWYTNFPIKDRPKHKHLKIIPLKEIPEKYKKYDDSKTLIVDNCYIPSDYKKPFAISIFPIFNGLLEKGYKIIQDTQYEPYVNRKRCFGRVLVQKV